MINGYFNNKGELFFDIGFIAADNSVITINAMLDTGFTDWLAMNIQDLESLGWPFIEKQDKLTAGGFAEFNLYMGTVFFDDQEITVPVLGGAEIANVLMGLQWLKTRRLVVDRRVSLLTLEESEFADA